MYRQQKIERFNFPINVELKGSAMKTFISNKQLSEHSYENHLINKIDQGYKEPQKEGPFNNQMAEQLSKLFKVQKSSWNELHLSGD